MRIALIVEGDTESALKGALLRLIAERVSTRHMPRFTWNVQRGRIPTGDSLRKLVARILKDRRQHPDAVIALTDVYTGPVIAFRDAADAKSKMARWVGPESRFYAHAAQYDFEAWLIPYWGVIQRLTGSNRRQPAHPERINHNKPPSRLLNEIFSAGTYRRSYIKTIDAQKILAGQDLTIAANACPELKSFLNTILTLCGGEQLP